MAKKKSEKKKTPKAGKATQKKAVKKRTVKKTVVKKKAAGTKKQAAAASRPAKETKATAKKAVKKSVQVKGAAAKGAPDKKVAKKAARKKGVRRATTTSGIRTKKTGPNLGRSRIPDDAPLDVVFQSDLAAREAFAFLGIHTVRELEQFEPDGLVMRLTSPAKQTVGRIRKILAMNNRCLFNDEGFASEFQDRLSQPQSTK